MSEATVFRSIKAITVSSYLSMFFLGISVSLIGAAARNIGLSPYQIGLLIAVQQVGFILSVSISGALADMVEKPRILLVGSLVLGFSFLTFYLSELFWINLVIMFGIGAGMATYEGVTDAMLLDIHTQHQSLHINVNHFFVTLGSIMITTYLLFLQVNWRQSVIQSGIVVLLLAVFFGLTKLENKPNRSDPYLKRLQILSRERILMVLYIAAALAVGVELGSVGILTTFLMELRGFSPVTSKAGLLVFLGSMAAGRVLFGFLTRRDQILQHILVLFGLSFLFFTGLYFLNLGRSTYIAICLAGMSLSALLPMIFALAGLLYQDIAGTVLGSIKVAGGLGGILLPFFMSVIAKSASWQVSLLLLPAASLLAFFMLFLEIRHIKTSAPGGD
jgi:MFS family permease